MNNQINGIILSQNTRNTSTNNVIVYGMDSSMLKHHVIVPNLLQTDDSIVVNDNDKSLFHQYAGYLASKGYEIQLMDFTHPEVSYHYNPMQFLYTTDGHINHNAVSSLVASMYSIKDTDETATATKDLLEACILVLLECYSEEKRNLYEVSRLIQKGMPKEENDKTALDLLFDAVEKLHPDTLCLASYSNYKTQPWNIKRACLAHAAQSLLKIIDARNGYRELTTTSYKAKARNLLNEIRIYKRDENGKPIPEQDNISFQRLCERKTAFFICGADRDEFGDLTQLACIFYKQLTAALTAYYRQDIVDIVSDNGTIIYKDINRSAALKLCEELRTCEIEYPEDYNGNYVREAIFDDDGDMIVPIAIGEFNTMFIDKLNPQLRDIEAPMLPEDAQEYRDILQTAHIESMNHAERPLRNMRMLVHKPDHTIITEIEDNLIRFRVIPEISILVTYPKKEPDITLGFEEWYIDRDDDGETPIIKTDRMFLGEFLYKTDVLLKNLGFTQTEFQYERNYALPSAQSKITIHDMPEDIKAVIDKEKSDNDMHTICAEEHTSIQEALDGIFKKGVNAGTRQIAEQILQMQDIEKVHKMCRKMLQRA